MKYYIVVRNGYEDIDTILLITPDKEKAEREYEEHLKEHIHFSLIETDDEGRCDI